MRTMTAFLIVVLTLLAFTPASAQGEDPALVLSLNRDFGYGGLDSSIEGLFTVGVSNPAGLSRVEFYLDEVLMATVDTEPFRFQFSTSNYAPGVHTLYALGYTAEGVLQHSNEITRTFLTKEQSQGAVVGLILPVVGGVLLVMALGVLIPTLLGRKARFTGSYGMLGGTVCPKCDLPFSYNFLAPNMLVGKLQRCPHCGRWSLVRRASAADLAAAEELWRSEKNRASSPADEKERARRQIDDSRYDS
jgi:hypothetical protein